MEIFYDPKFEGLSTDDLSKLWLWDDGIYTEQDLDELCEARGHILRQMRDAIEDRNVDWLGKLEVVYDDVSASIEGILKLWPANDIPACATKKRFA